MNVEKKEADVSVTADVKVQPSSKNTSYKTKIMFVNGQKKDIVSELAPQVQPSGLVQFVLSDRVIVVPLGVILWSETEQLLAVEPSKIIVSAK